MSAFLGADNSTHIINSNFASRRVKSRKHNFDLNFCRQRRLFSSKDKQPTHSDIGATTYFAILLYLSPSEKRRYGELDNRRNALRPFEETTVPFLLERDKAP